MACCGPGAGLIRISASLPVPLLLGLRLAARRPRRMMLTAASVMLTVTVLVAVLAAHAAAAQQSGAGSPDNPTFGRVGHVMLVLTVVLVTLAAVNTIVVAWATMLDTRRPSALARSLGATPRQVTFGLSMAQVLPALPGALLGIPLGIALFAVVNSGGLLAVPPAWRLAAAVLGTLVATAVLAAVPASLGARRPVAPVLRSEAF